MNEMEGIFSLPLYFILKVEGPTIDFPPQTIEICVGSLIFRCYQLQVLLFGSTFLSEILEGLLSIQYKRSKYLLTKDIQFGRKS